MLSPFPGMDPYLEHPQLWPEVHHLLLSACSPLRTRKERSCFGMRCLGARASGCASQKTVNGCQRAQDHTQ